VLRVGVSSEPGVINLELDPSHKLIILASDGVWEFISSKEAVDLVAKAESPEEGCRLVGGGCICPVEGALFAAVNSPWNAFVGRLEGGHCYKGTYRH
jgi:hypothetical protein